MVNDMTSNFRENLFKYLSEFMDQYGSSPSFSQIAEAMGISPRSKSLITRSLRILEKEGRVSLAKDGRRLLISLASKQLPLLGRISAGSPIEAISEHQFVDVDTIFHGDNRFALQVKGSSMIDEGIMDGDIIICKKSASAEEGEIVVVLIDGHNTTLKRISYKLKGMITLVPANVNLKPRAYMPERIMIQGLYIGLIRSNG